MKCCSFQCERYQDCMLSIYNNPNVTEAVEDYYNFGATSIVWTPDGVKDDSYYACGPAGKFKMFMANVPWAEYKPEEVHQITIDEILSLVDEEEKEYTNTIKNQIIINGKTYELSTDITYRLREIKDGTV